MKNGINSGGLNPRSLRYESSTCAMIQSKENRMILYHWGVVIIFPHKVQFQLINFHLIEIIIKLFKMSFNIFDNSLYVKLIYLLCGDPPELFPSDPNRLCFLGRCWSCGSKRHPGAAPKLFSSKKFQFLEGLKQFNFLNAFVVKKFKLIFEEMFYSSNKYSQTCYLKYGCWQLLFKKWGKIGEEPWSSG